MTLGVRLEEQLSDVIESHCTGVLKIYQNYVAIENKIGTCHLECLVTEIPMNHDEVMRDIALAMYFKVYRKVRPLYGGLKVWLRLWHRLESVVLPQQPANEMRKRSTGCQASVASSLHARVRGLSAPGPQQEAQCLTNQR